MSSNHKPIHLNRLMPSTPDDVSLCRAVSERFVLLCNVHFKMKGVQLVPPKSLDGDMLRWRAMAVRHKRGDLRHTLGEMKSLRTVGQWTVDVHMKLRNQPPVKVEWER